MVKDESVENNKTEKLKKQIVINFDRAKFKESVRNRLVGYTFLYIPTRFAYRVARKAKLIIFNNYDNNIAQIDQQNQQLLNQINTIKGEILLIEEKNKALISEKQKIEELVENNNSFDYKNIFYYHGGSGNHGCEALIRTIIDLGNFKREENCLCSYVAEEDFRFGINNIIKYIKQSNQDTEEIRKSYLPKDAVAFSIGGDNYCGYDYGTKRLAKYNEMFNEKGIKTALIGCSIEPSVLEHQEVLDDLNRFSLITARETITYEALLEKGIDRNTHYIPDSAFVLEPSYLPLPEGFEEGNTIGINVSNLIQSYDTKSDLTYENFKYLIQYIIDKTSYQVALIPHVVQPHNDDMQTLQRLYSDFKLSDRVILIREHNCSEIKGYIGRCKMLVCTRTHASIAAYSMGIPTLVLGYSVKSRGIAKDIFDTDKNYVLSVHELKAKEDLTNTFKWLENEYSKIKKHLEDFMPGYKKRCYELTALIEEFKKLKQANLALAKTSLCTGCGACSTICPNKCIEMKPNSEGFLYPVTDYTKCSNCDLCKKACPINSNIISQKSNTVFAAINNNSKTRLNSSSGGVFSRLAEATIKSGGVVFGAGYDKDNNVCHMAVDNIKDLYKLMGSKYVQSELKDCYLKVNKLLKKNIKVLFSGTPCQILGLKQYINKQYDNLFCIDVICHGVPSPKVFKKYCMKLENEFESDITNVNFREKSRGWRLYNICFKFKNGKTLSNRYPDDIFMKGFLNNLILRKSCYNCPANNFRSGSDITLGDYWGVWEIHPEIDDDKGVSLVVVNTRKGEAMLKTIEKDLCLIKSDIEFAIKKNQCIIKSVQTHNNRTLFFDNIDNKDIVELLNENLK